MELRSGYKKTEVGVLPDEWGVETLGAITTLLTNGFVGTVTNFYTKHDDGVLYIQGYNVEANGYNLHGIKRVTKAFHLQHQKSCLQEGDLLTIQTGDIGVTTFVPKEFEGANCHALVISRFDKRTAVPSYYCQYFNSELGRIAFKEIETGTTMKHLNVGDMFKLPLPVPPLPEQRAIAAALSDVDTMIASLDRLIAKKRDMKQATMQVLLTGKRRLPGFSGEWKVMKLGEVADPDKKWSFTGGPFGSNLKFSDYTGEGVRIIQLQNIGNGEFHNDSEVFTSPEKADELLSCNIYPGEIILSKMGDPVARACIIPPHCERYLMCSDGIRLVVNPNKFSTYFVYISINAPEFRTRAGNAGTGSTRKRIGLKELRNLELICPELPEQTAIATIISDMDADIATMEQKLDKTRMLKQGMMQELLTGRIRLV